MRPLRLKREQDILLAEYNELMDKLKILRLARVRETQPDSKFRLDAEIYELDRRLSEVEKQLDILDGEILPEEIGEPTESNTKKIKRRKSQKTQANLNQNLTDSTVNSLGRDKNKEAAKSRPKANLPDQMTPQSPTPASTVIAKPVHINQQTAKLVSTMVVENVNIQWARVPEGNFKRGCPESFIKYVVNKYGLDPDVFNSFQEREEYIGAFWVSLTPITNQQYWVFVENTNHKYPVGWLGKKPPYPRPDSNKPVTGVTWNDCLDFARWIGARLPKRAEYEKACRGENGFLYPWGNKFDTSKCNTAESKIEQLTSVASYPGGASVYGILDLVGNVWEWSADIYKSNNYKMTVGASYRSTGEIYGAGFFDLSRHQDSQEDILGFRVACDDVHQLQVLSLTADEDLQ